MTAPIKVLLVEDSPSDAALLQESLADDCPGAFGIVWVETWAQATKALKRDAFDVLLLDLTLPDTSGRDTFRAARAKVPQMPIVVLTGMEDEAVGLEAMRHGVQDYLIKNHTDGRQTARAIRYAIERKRIERELREARDELERRVQERTADLKHTVDILQAEIGQRRAAEDALRDSERKYRTLFELAPVGIGIFDHRGEVLAFNRHLCSMLDLTFQEAQSRNIESFIAEPAQRRQLRTHLAGGGKVADWEVHLRRRDHSRLVGLLRMEKTQLGSHDVFLTIVQDVTRQKHAEKHIAGVAALLELFATKSSRQKYLEAVVELLSHWCTCRCVGIRLLDHAGRIPYVAHLGFSRTFLKKETEICLRESGGCACVRVLTGRLSSADAEFSSNGGSFFCNEASRFVARLSPGLEPAPRIECVEAGYESLAQTPIRYRGQLLGTLHLADSHPGRLTEQAIAFLEATAPLVGEAIHRFDVEESLLESEARFRSMFEHHNAVMLLLDAKTGALVDVNPAAASFYGYSREQLRQMHIDQLKAVPGNGARGKSRSKQREPERCQVSPHRLASGEIRIVEVHSSAFQAKGRRLLFCILHDITERRQLEKQVLDISEQERQRLGQDLHDSLGGRLAGAALMSKALAQRLVSGVSPEAALAEEIVRCINESISQTRAIARGLCPVELSLSGLVGGLAEFAAQTQRHSGVICRFQHDKKVHVPELFVATHLFRIVQEAVNNALRHGCPRAITIRLTAAAGATLLEIRDDGRGLPPNLERAKGMGLRTMKYRANIIGARFSVGPADGGGTIVSCLLPESHASANSLAYAGKKKP